MLADIPLSISSETSLNSGAALEFYDVSISWVGNNHASEPCGVRAGWGDKDGSRMATADLATCDETSPLRLHNVVFDN